MIDRLDNKMQEEERKMYDTQTQGILVQKQSDRVAIGWFLAVMIAMVFLNTGCGTTPKPKPKEYTIRVIPKTDAPIRVDIIGANQSEIEGWDSLKVDEYWKDGSNFRKTALENGITLKLPQEADKGVISDEDPIWEKWFSRRVLYLVVIADLPFKQEVMEGRRQIIKLDKGEHKRTRVLDVEINQGRITVVDRKKVPKEES